MSATRTVGQAKMYRLNKQSPIAKKLMELDDAISEYFAQKRCLSAAESLQENVSEAVAAGRELIKAAVD